MANFQLVSQFSQEEQNENKRFVEASAAELEELSKKSFKKNTQYATRNAVSIYTKFCEQLGIQSDLRKMTKLTLAEILKKLYAWARKQDGELYKLTAYNAMRYGISRYVLAETGWDIIKEDILKLYSGFDISTPSGLLEKVWFDLVLHVTLSTWP